MKTFTSGAKSTEEAPRYDLLEPACLKKMAARMAQGAASHGPKNYRKGKGDPAFRQDRVNHLVGHVLKYAAGETDEDHLSAILANANILSYLDDPETGTDVLDSSTWDPKLVKASRGHYDDRQASARPCARCQRKSVTRPCTEAGPCPYDRKR